MNLKHFKFNIADDLEYLLQSDYFNERALVGSSSIIVMFDKYIIIMRTSAIIFNAEPNG